VRYGAGVDAGIVEYSAKMTVLKKLLSEIVAKGERVIVFSQKLETLTFIEVCSVHAVHARAVAGSSDAGHVAAYAGAAERGGRGREGCCAREAEAAR
jgi:hypothetical protein